MPEKGPVYKTYAISGGEMPLSVRALVKRDAQAQRHLNLLRDSGAVFTFHRLRKTPQGIREKLAKRDDSFKVITHASAPSVSGEDELVPQVRRTFTSSMSFTIGNTPNLAQTESLHYLNRAIAERRTIHGMVHTLFDRPKKELQNLFGIGSISALVAAGVTLAEAVGLKGIGLVLAQSVDDVGNAALFGLSDEGGTKKVKEIIKDNWPVIPILGAAALADNPMIPGFTGIIPHLLESPSTVMKATGGLLFSLAAVGGSLAAAGLDVRRKYKARKSKEPKESRIKSLREGAKQTFSHPFKAFLIAGVGLSPPLSEFAAAKGFIVDHWYSGTLQTFLGQVETIAGYGGLLLSKSIYSALTNTVDLATIGKSHIRDALQKIPKIKHSRKKAISSPVSQSAPVEQAGSSAAPRDGE